MKSTQELNEQQKKDLDNIMNKGIKIPRIDRRIINKILMSLIIVVFILVMYISQRKETPLQSIDDTVCSSTKTELNISMNKDNKLDYVISSISVTNDNNESIEVNNIDWLTSNIDTNYDKYKIDGQEYTIDKTIKLNNILLYKDHAYIEYKNNNGTANKEFILASSKPSDIELDNIQKVNSRFYEKSNPIQLKSYINSFNNSFILLSETLGGGELNIDTLKDELLEIENTVKTSNINDGIIINFDELGEIKLNNINSIKSPRILYTAEDDVLRIQEYDTNTDLVYITSINNEVINCKPEDLVKTGVENLFIHKNFGNTDNIGYNTFGIITEKNLYIIKFNSKDDNIKKEWFEQLNINIENLSIEKIQEVIKKS